MGCWNIWRAKNWFPKYSSKQCSLLHRMRSGVRFSYEHYDTISYMLWRSDLIRKSIITFFFPLGHFSNNIILEISFDIRKKAMRFSARDMKNTRTISIWNWNRVSYPKLHDLVYLVHTSCKSIFTMYNFLTKVVISRKQNIAGQRITMEMGLAITKSNNLRYLDPYVLDRISLNVLRRIS